MSNTFFQGGGEKFSSGGFAPCGPLVTGQVISVMKNLLSNKKVFQMFMFSLQKEIWRRGYKQISIRLYRFKSNNHTHVFVGNRNPNNEMGAQMLNGAAGHHCPPLPLSTALFLLYDNTGLFWCAIWVYLKSLNGSPACNCWTQTSWQVMQRDSDTADSGKPRKVIYCVKRSMSKSVAMLPQVWKIHC